MIADAAISVIATPENRWHSSDLGQFLARYLNRVRAATMVNFTLFARLPCVHQSMRAFLIA
jgi:hypothetical protein